MADYPVLAATASTAKDPFFCAVAMAKLWEPTIGDIIDALFKARLDPPDRFRLFIGVITAVFGRDITGSTLCLSLYWPVADTRVLLIGLRFGLDRKFLASCEFKRIMPSARDAVAVVPD